jgi:hypothetical protein
VFNAFFNNISVILWRAVLLVEETEVFIFGNKMCQTWCKQFVNAGIGTLY